MPSPAWSLSVSTPLSHPEETPSQGHDRAYELAGRLAEFIPYPIEKVAFTAGGSDANDTAVKIAWYYNNSLGRTNKKKVAPPGARHHSRIGRGE